MNLIISIPELIYYIATYLPERDIISFYVAFKLDMPFQLVNMVYESNSNKCYICKTPDPGYACLLCTNEFCKYCKECLWEFSCLRQNNYDSLLYEYHKFIYCYDHDLKCCKCNKPAIKHVESNNLAVCENYDCHNLICVNPKYPVYFQKPYNNKCGQIGFDGYLYCSFECVNKK